MRIIKKQAFLALAVIMALLFGGPVTAEINFFRMFLKAPELQPLPQYYLLAQYQSDEGALFLAVHNEDKSYVLFELGRTIDLGLMSVTAKSFDGNGNYAMGLKEHIVFPEIDYDKIDKIRGMDIVITTTAKNDEEGRALLDAFNFPFKK